ncbi:hypothetical protein BD410DRAFT_787387 [Rickenella mellea]|uniref:Uncharacterized protein n=1 Tax=Rickenella mellea TaxID=50990 RepID=A0A4Y7Q8V7_9AGAM|nr:hypothetical protein BD410DRAFT_787387 [Rickenella mellea]
MQKQFLQIFEHSGVDIDRLSQSLRWLLYDVIVKAKEAVTHLRKSNGDSDDLSTERAISEILCLLQSMKMMRTRNEFSNFGRLLIINSLLSQLMRSQHDTREHSAAVLDTLERVIQPNLSPNDADLETQMNFLRLQKDAVSHHSAPLTFPVV